jgi:hypothetical protein
MIMAHKKSAHQPRQLEILKIPLKSTEAMRLGIHSANGSLWWERSTDQWSKGVAKSRKAVGVVVKERIRSEASAALKGTGGAPVRFMTRDSFEKASAAANSSLRAAVARSQKVSR